MSDPMNEAIRKAARRNTITAGPGGTVAYDHRGDRVPDGADGQAVDPTGTPPRRRTGSADGGAGQDDDGSRRPPTMTDVMRADWQAARDRRGA
jgi:hypothetical protein